MPFPGHFSFPKSKPSGEGVANGDFSPSETKKNTDFTAETDGDVLP